MEQRLDDVLKKIGQFPGGKKDPFADPYGPTSNCFSSNDIVRMFDLGATLRDREHFQACEACKERIVKHAEAMQPPVTARRKRWFGVGEPVPAAGWAPLGLVYSPATCVVDQQGMVESIAIEILTKVSPELEGMEVTLNGPVVGSVVPEWKGNRFYIRNVQVSSDVVRILREHRGYIQPAQLQFGASAGAPRLVVNCNLEFSRTAE
jgi:hypothetical protein